MEVISIPSPKGKSNKEPTLVDAIRGLNAGELMFHNHVDRKSIFSRWLAVTRQRTGLRLRHTNKAVDWVCFSIEEIPLQNGIGIFDDGCESYFIEVASGVAKLLTEKSINSLDKGHYWVWVWDLKSLKAA